MLKIGVNIEDTYEIYKINYRIIRTLCCCLRGGRDPIVFVVAHRALAAAEMYVALPRLAAGIAGGLVALVHVREAALHFDFLGACSRKQEYKQKIKQIYLRIIWQAVHTGHIVGAPQNIAAGKFVSLHLAALDGDGAIVVRGAILLVIVFAVNVVALGQDGTTSRRQQHMAGCPKKIQ